MITASEKAKLENVTLREYIRSGTDPSVNVVLLEDSCAVLGCFVAAACMYLTQITSNHYFDAAGSMIIGGMLGGVASFLMRQNSRYLIGLSIPQEFVLEIQDWVCGDVLKFRTFFNLFVDFLYRHVDSDERFFEFLPFFELFCLNCFCMHFFFYFLCLNFL